jgi:hypothetical protein
MSKKETVAPESVTMQDGTIVEFAGERKMLKTVSVDREAGTVSVRFDFRNGQTRTYTVHPALLLDCAGHGASQKIGDESAGAETIEDMVMATDAMIDRLSSGDPEQWRKRSEGGKSFSGASLLLQALILFKPAAPREVLAEFVKNKTKAERDALQRSPELEPFVKQVQAERDKKKGIDAGALVGQLADIPG